MAVKNKITDEQERLFERDLLQVLGRDPDHQFAFDGKLRVFSSRYRCELRAVSVELSPEGDVVFVGAFLRGEPQFDTSKGYRTVVPELRIPFSECFNDLRTTPGFNEAYLVSKTRKAVLDKCVAHPMQLLDVSGLSSRGKVEMLETAVIAGASGVGDVRVGSVACRDGMVTVETDDGVPVGVSRMRLTDIQRLGRSLHTMNAYVREVRKDFIEAKNASLPSRNGSFSENDIRLGEEAGLAAIYGKHPLPYCDAVARTFAVTHKDVFDVSRRSAAEIDRMIRDYRENGKPFGFPEEKRKSLTVKR